ncbi:MAG: hypothetical protein R8M37_00535 [Alphaproteobacteria bacterium]|nr:hypothetical protein [Alphaproteobacteria bacterium]
MKRLAILFFMLQVCETYAASCQAGYLLIDEPAVAIADSCPAGTVSVGVGEPCTGEDSSSVCWVVEKVSKLCDFGLQHMKTSTGVSFPLYAEKYTTPAIHVRYNGGICYVNLSSGRASDSINVEYNGVVYHAVK